MLFNELAGVLNLLPVPVIVCDLQATIVFTNTASQALLQKEAGALHGQPLSHCLGSPPLEVSTSEIDLAGERGLLVLLQPSQPIAAAPERSNADLAEALLRNERRLRHATEAARVGIFDHPVQPPAEPPYWSPTLRSMLGVSPDEPTNFEWFHKRVHPDDVHILEEGIAHATGPAGDAVIDIEYRWLHPEKGYRWLFNRSITEFANVSGERVPIRGIGAILDVTERRAAEQEQRLRAAILDATPDFVAISLLDGTLTYLNKAARAFLGLEHDASLEGRTLDEAHPDSISKLLHSVAIPAAVMRGSWAAETEFLRHDGRVVPMSHVVLAQRDSTGQMTYLCTIARDLSKERALEEQFRHAQKMEAIGRLAAGVAHDFNNLLSVILGYADIASSEYLRGADAQKPLTEIVRAAERAAALTSQLLAFGRRQILKPRVLDINEVLTDFTPMVSRLIDERIELNVNAAPSPANVRADPNQIQQVLLNLVVNARDAMPDGGLLTIEAFRVQLDEHQTAEKLGLVPGAYAVVAVSDTGHGMDTVTRERIFEPFFTTKGPGKGTGLGLATAFGIVKQSGGGIWVYSEVGRGTTFKVYLPCTDEATDTPLRPPPRVDMTRGGVILLCEDDEQVRNMVTNVLLRAGYQVLSAASPAEALELSSDHAGSIDLLLTDVVMPGMTGAVLAERLHETRPGLPVLFTSGYTENTIVHRGILDEGVEFLAKPITPGRLLAMIPEVLQRHGRV